MCSSGHLVICLQYHPLPFLGTLGYALDHSGQAKFPGNVSLRVGTASVPGDSASNTVKRHQEVGAGVP